MLRLRQRGRVVLYEGTTCMKGLEAEERREDRVLVMGSELLCMPGWVVSRAWHHQQLHCA